MERQRDLNVLNDSGTSRAPHSTKQTLKMHEAVYFQCLWGRSRPHPPKQTMNMCGNCYIFNGSGVAHAPRPTKQTMKMFGNQYIFDDSGVSHGLQYSAQAMKMQEILAISMLLGPGVSQLPAGSASTQASKQISKDMAAQNHRQKGGCAGLCGG